MKLNHGTRHAYNEGCRCKRCREVNRTTQGERREHVRSLRKWVDGRLTSPYAQHGTTNGYNSWQCRCAPCTEANSVSCREWRQRRKQRKQRKNA